MCGRYVRRSDKQMPEPWTDEVKELWRLEGMDVRGEFDPPE